MSMNYIYACMYVCICIYAYILTKTYTQKKTFIQCFETVNLQLLEKGLSYMDMSIKSCPITVYVKEDQACPLAIFTSTVCFCVCFFNWIH